MLEHTLAIVLAGSRGEGLGPLTVDRAKAAIPFGGEYRLIDFSLTNCLHSGLRRVYVSTDYQARSLEQHLRDGWNLFNPHLGEFLTPVGPPRPFDFGSPSRAGPAPQPGSDTAGLSDGGAETYGGSTDALVDHRELIRSSGARYLVVIPGDQVYRMDYAAMLDAHARGGQAVTLACAELTAGTVTGHPRTHFGDDNRITALEVEAASGAAPGRRWVSMGVTVMSITHALGLLDRLASEPGRAGDFERDVLAELARETHVAAYRFGGKEGRVSQDRYWSDVRNTDEYFAANLALLEPIPPLDLYQDNWAIWSVPGKNPPARTVASGRGNEGIFVNSIVSNGTVITGGAVSFSVLSPRVRVQDSATVERSILFEGVVIGEGARIRNCIIDKFVHIEPGDAIGFDIDEDTRRFPVSEGGVVIVTKGHAGA